MHAVRESTISAERPSHDTGWSTRVASARAYFARNWLLELIVMAGLAVAYNVVRGMPQSTGSVAVAHARSIMSAEGILFDDIELPLNSWVVGLPWIAIIACYVYAAMHYVVTPVIFFVSRSKGGSQYWRGYWALVVTSGLAVAVYALYPVAPPRLVPRLDIVDVMSDYSYAGWWGGAASAPHGLGDATNQFAAMPSMHVGWALWCAVLMWGFRGRAWRVLAVLYPLLVAVVVLATGNHFLLDIVGGALCVVVAYVIVRWVSARTGRGSPDQPASASVS